MFQFFQKSFSQFKNEQLLNPNGFGTFFGVFIPNATIMFGVIIFLRLHLVLGYLGLTQTTVAILLGLGLMLITSFSIAAIVTNMRVGSGGTYYMISRLLGVEIGASIGILLFIAQIISIALCVSGFAYSLLAIIPNLSISLIELLTLLFLAIIAIVSASFALKVQSVVLLLLLAAYFGIIWGRMPQDGIDIASYFPKGLSFWEGFAIFFPALTGIEAGNALSGTLKRPARSITIGNISSLLFMAALYLFLVIFLHLHIPSLFLRSDPFLLIKYSRFESLALAGIWAATLSSALGGLLGTPRILQALAEDGALPSIFARTSGEYKEPKVAVAVVLIGAIIVALATDIDQLIPILTMISLITYATINFVVGISELINHHSWRPSLRPHWALSLLGAFGCVFIMFMISPGWSFVSFCLIASAWLLMKRKNIKASFKDIRENILFYFSRQALYKLSNSVEHALSWHPQLLVFAIAPQERKELVLFSHHICERNGILTFASIVPDSWSTKYKLIATRNVLDEHFQKKNIYCLVEVQPSQDLSEGILSLIKNYGIGSLQPNTIVISYSDLPQDPLFLSQLLGMCSLIKKNLIIYKESPQNDLFSKKHVRVDLWWDNDCSLSFNLMLSLALSIKDSKVWKSANWQLHAIAQDNRTLENLEEYFAKFVLQGRIPMHPFIHLDEGKEEYKKKICAFSEHANCVWIPMQTLYEDLSKEAHANHVKNTLSCLSGIKSYALIFAFDGIEHKELYR